MSNLDTSLQYLKGVGPKKIKSFLKLEIKTIRDLLYYFPRTYEDRRNFVKLIDCKDGQKANCRVIISGLPTVFRPRRGLTITKIPVKDDSAAGSLVWFNQNYIKDKFSIGESIKVNGKIKRVGMDIQIHQPYSEKDNGKNRLVGRIVPIYSLTGKISNNEIITLVSLILREYLNFEEDVLPDYILKENNYPDIKEALINIHFPKDKDSYLTSRKRLVFEELLLLQLGLFALKNKCHQIEKGIKFIETKQINKFLKSLPFELTNAQKRVFNEIITDMESHNSMNRLVQGDVGSGKTIIAVLAIMKAHFSGYQSVMMAPTEILAKQHYESITNLLKEYDIRCELLVGSLTNKEKTNLLEKIKNGDVDIVIGTHAIIQDNVEFKALGIAITDEQHRFGVRQRAMLSSKGYNPDVLVMTATPIPRTLALILYGDLDISIIDELPPGRKQVKTYAVDSKMKERAYNFIRHQIAEGRQAYIVCPLVEESEKLDIKSAVQLYEELKSGCFKDLRLGLLHGKMKAVEKDDIMSKFINHDIDILISTTVIEVGVNVSNASIMLIENAERFGLAQLHQLRGRVGRGEYQSYCILANESRSKVSKERMNIVENSTDGFVISEKDLEIRGPGEFFGTRQHGIPKLKIANIFNDISVLKNAQSAAQRIINEDPKLNLEKHIKLKNKIIKMFKEELEEISFN